MHGHREDEGREDGAQLDEHRQAEVADTAEEHGDGADKQQPADHAQRATPPGDDSGGRPDEEDGGERGWHPERHGRVRPDRELHATEGQREHGDEEERRA
ncbi:hypothetical protein ACFPRL_05160 [Pseudoclavibacter helvolus]